MSNAVTAVEVQSDANPAYRMTAESATGSYYLYTGITDASVRGIDSEKIVTCAGLPHERALVVLDQIENGGVVGIEILSPAKINHSERPDSTEVAIEVMVGADYGDDLVTIENGISFDQSDAGYFPGIEVDYTQEGEMVAIRVDQTEVTGRLL